MEQRLDFDELAGQIGVLNTRAQATLMYRILQHFGPQVLRTTIRYSYDRIDQINNPLPAEQSKLKEPVLQGDEKL